MYSRRRNTADVTTGNESMEPLEREFADQRLSASMGEVGETRDLLGEVGTLKLLLFCQTVTQIEDL